VVFCLIIDLMIKWFKKHFIPHVGNDHRPHFLRAKNTKSLLGVVLLVELIAFILPTVNFTNLVSLTNMGAVLPAVLGSLTNQERQSNNLTVLRENVLLNEAARLKAEDMASKGYFAHTSPEGKTPWYWLDTVGYEYSYAGENLAINFSDSEDVTQAWMNSPTHRANIVKSSYTEVGTGIATGMYEGRDTVFVAQVYANPRPQETEVIQVESRVVSPVATPNDILNNSDQVLGASVESLPAPTIIEKVVASPRHSTNVILWVIFGIITSAMFLNVLLRRKGIKHRDLVVNGMAVIAVLALVFLLNNYFGTKDIVIGRSIEYTVNSFK
jgi:Uncharacterized protein with SCP/PR1 domains